MKKHFNLSFLLATVAVLCCCIQPALAWSGPSAGAFTPAERARERQLEELKKHGDEPGTAAKIVPFLKDPLSALRDRAVRALGELEDPIAIEPLERALARSDALLSGTPLPKEPPTEEPVIEAPVAETSRYDETPQDTRRSIDLLTLRLALGRISSRGLHGQAKVEATLSRLNFTWPELIAFSQKANSEENPLLVETHGADKITNAVVDVLWSMSKNGEDIEPLLTQLTLLPPQRIYVQTAKLDPKAKVQFLLHALIDENQIGRGSERLERLLRDLEPETTKAVRVRFEEMRAHPHEYYGLEPYPGDPNAFRERIGYMRIFDMVGLTRDPSMIPGLREFEQMNDPSMSQDARQTREYIERMNK